MTLNIPAPPGFRGLHPDIPVTKYQRHLPHWRQEGATYFVTFRLADSLPQSVQDYLIRLQIDWHQKHPPPWSDAVWNEYARTVHDTIERELDEGYGVCWLRDADVATCLERRMLDEVPAKCHIGCWAVMPNHVHIVMRPLADDRLERILQRWKSKSALDINVCVGRSGQVWQQESYDRIIRDEEHLWRVVQYIGRNPARAGLPRETWRRWIDPEWEAAGWKFIDELETLNP